MPLGESMITVIRSNRRKKVNDSYFKIEATSTKNKQKENFDHTSASPELLQEIKTTIDVQQRKRKKVLRIIGIFIFSILAILLWYLKNQNYI